MGTQSSYHLTPPHWAFKNTLSRYRDVNPVPTNTIGDDIATAPSGPVGNSTHVDITYAHGESCPGDLSFETDINGLTNHIPPFKTYMIALQKLCSILYHGRKGWPRLEQAPTTNMHYSSLLRMCIL